MTIPVMHALAHHYAAAGLPEDAWHVGPEHPALEDFVIDRLRRMTGKRVLEIAVQAGGFAIPVVSALHLEPGFAYTGVENHAYPNAVPFSLVEAFLDGQGLRGAVTLVESDGEAFLRHVPPASFDLILLDHFKPLYPGSLLEICEGRVLAPSGIVFCHDVLGNARDIWPACVAIGRLFGFRATVHAGVPQGLGELRLDGEYRSPGRVRLLAWRARLGWASWLRTVNRRGRGAVRRVLRAAGVRRFR